MVTALNLYAIKLAATTLTTAQQFATTTTTASGVGVLSLVGSTTGWGEVWSQGNTGAWAGAGSIGSPTGQGFLYETTALEGQQFVAGNWSTLMRMKASAGTCVCDMHVRLYVYHSNGTYTQIGSDFVSSGISITSTVTTYTVTASLAATTFNTGDKLYVDVWLNVTTAPGSTDKVGFVYQNSTTSGAANLCEIDTPGYQVASSTTTVNLVDTPLSLTETIAVTVIDMASDIVVSSDTLTIVLTDIASDTLSITEISTFTLNTQGIDTLAISEQGTVALALLSSDTLSSLDATTTTTINNASDSLILSENTQITLLAQSQDQLTINETGQEGLTVSSSDALVVTDTVQATVPMSSIENVGFLSDALIYTQVFAPIDSLTYSEQATWLQAVALIEQAGTLSETEQQTEILLIVDNLLVSEYNTATENSQSIDMLSSSEGYQTISSVMAQEISGSLLDTLQETEELNVTDALACNEQALITLVFSTVESIGVLSDTVTSSEATASNLVDTGLFPQDNLQVTLAVLAQDSLESIDVYQTQVTGILTDNPLFTSESLIASLAFQVSEILATTEIATFSLITGLSDGIAVIESVATLLQENNSEMLLAVDVVQERLTVAIVEYATLTDTSSIAGILVAADVLTANDTLQSAEVAAYNLSDTLTVQETNSISLQVLFQENLDVADSFSSSFVILGSTMSGTDQCTVQETLLPTVLVTPTDQLGSIVDQSTTTGAFLPVDTLVCTDESYMASDTPVSFVDQMIASDSIIVTWEQVIDDTLLISFDRLDIILAIQAIDHVNTSDTLSSNTVMTVSFVETLSVSETGTVTVQANIADSTPVSDGFAAHPFALTIALIDNAFFTDTITAIAQVALVDTAITLSDTPGATYQLLFADTLVCHDAETVTLTATIAEAALPSSDTIISVSYDNRLMDSVTVSDNLIVLAVYAPAADTLYQTEVAIVAIAQYTTVSQFTRTGDLAQSIRTGTLVQRIRTGINDVTIRTGTYTVHVRDGILEPS